MPTIIHLNTIAELRAAAPAWDDLWQRSDCTSPLARAEPIADWLAHFAPARRFQALVVAEEGRWLAALPLVEGRIAGVLRGGVLACNAWPSGATLLWDAAATADHGVGEAVAASAARLPWPLVFLEAAMPARASWRALYDGLIAADMPCDLRTRWHVGRLAIEHDWPAAFGRLSRKHRQRISASLRKMADRGEVRFQLHTNLSPHEVEPLLRRAWETEAGGWKGAAGTAVLRTPGAADFMLAQACWLAADGRLRLAFLDCGGRNVAFCYGVLGKGVFHSFKIGYDPAFAPFAPGHLLQYHLLQDLHADSRVTAVDYSLDISAGGDSNFALPTPTNRKELLEVFDKNRIEARAALAAGTDAAYAKPWALLMGEQELFREPRAAVLRRMVFNHIIHHRGQLTMYFRLLNIPVPALYGPSADEQKF